MKAQYRPWVQLGSLNCAKAYEPQFISSELIPHINREPSFFKSKVTAFNKQMNCMHSAYIYRTLKLKSSLYVMNCCG